MVIDLKVVELLVSLADGQDKNNEQHPARLLSPKYHDYNNKLNRSPSKQIKTQKSKKATTLESDEEVTSLSSQLTSKQENIPRYAQSTISRFLMINDSFDMVGTNHTLASDAYVTFSLIDFSE